MKNNAASKAIDLFQTIKNPNRVILILLLNACAQLQNDAALTLVKQISSNLSEAQVSNPHLVTSLLDALMKCGDVKSAESIFGKIKRSVFDYASLMTGFNHNNQPEKTLGLFDRMRRESIEPNCVVCLCVIQALAQFGVSSLSATVVEQMPKAHLENDRIRNALIDMWVSDGRQRVLSRGTDMRILDLRREKLVASIEQRKSFEKLLNLINLDSTAWVCANRCIGLVMPRIP